MAGVNERSAIAQILIQDRAGFGGFGEILLRQEQRRVLGGLGDRGSGVRDDRRPKMHRLEEWYPDALVLRERDEARGAAVVRDERRERDGAGEAHRAGEPQRLREGAQTRVVLRLIAVRADEDEDRVGVDAAAVVREHADEVVLPLVRRDPSDEE